MPSRYIHTSRHGQEKLPSGDITTYRYHECQLERLYIVGRRDNRCTGEQLDT